MLMCSISEKSERTGTAWREEIVGSAVDLLDDLPSFMMERIRY